MSFSDDMALARVDTLPTDRCDGCGCPPHPTTLSLYQIIRTGRRLCGSCFFVELEEERRRVRQSELYREQLRERQFTSILFMGNGNHSLMRKRDLSERLEVAVEFLGGAQQAPMSTDTKECCYAYGEFCEEADAVIDAAVRDVAMALTGKEWEPKEE